MTSGHRTITADQVAGLLRRLPRGKVPGADGVTSEHLVHGCSPTLLSALARLLSACLAACNVPAAFAESVIVPLLKKSQLDPSQMDNYRPISLTTCVSKLLEMLVLDDWRSTSRPMICSSGLPGSEAPARHQFWPSRPSSGTGAATCRSTRRIWMPENALTRSGTTASSRV